VNSPTSAPSATNGLKASPRTIWMRPTGSPVAMPNLSSRRDCVVSPDFPNFGGLYLTPRGVVNGPGGLYNDALRPGALVAADRGAAQP